MGNLAVLGFDLGEGRVSFALQLVLKGLCLGVKLWLCSWACGWSQQQKAGDRKTEKAALRRSRLSPETKILTWGVSLTPSGQEIWV